MSPDDRELLVACYQLVFGLFLYVGYILLIACVVAGLCAAVGGTLVGLAHKFKKGYHE